MNKEDYYGKRYLPVEGEDNRGYVRDLKSNAIILQDSGEYDKYMQSYNERQKRRREVASLQKEVHDLKSDVSDIKSLLLQLINKEKN
jgi:hypothetical protein